MFNIFYELHVDFEIPVREIKDFNDLYEKVIR